MRPYELLQIVIAFLEGKDADNNYNKLVEFMNLRNQARVVTHDLNGKRYTIKKPFLRKKITVSVKDITKDGK